MPQANPIREEFQVHLLNEQGLNGAKAIAMILSDALTKLEKINSKPSREMSLVKTHLQDAGFWAKRALAVNPAMQIKGDTVRIEDDGDRPNPYTKND